MRMMLTRHSSGEERVAKAKAKARGVARAKAKAEARAAVAAEPGLRDPLRMTNPRRKRQLRNFERGGRVFPTPSRPGRWRPKRQPRSRSRALGRRWQRAMQEAGRAPPRADLTDIEARGCAS